MCVLSLLVFFLQSRYPHPHPVVDGNVDADRSDLPKNPHPPREGGDGFDDWTENISLIERNQLQHPQLFPPRLEESGEVEGEIEGEEEGDSEGTVEVEEGVASN